MNSKWDSDMTDLSNQYWSTEIETMSDFEKSKLLSTIIERCISFGDNPLADDASLDHINQNANWEK